MGFLEPRIYSHQALPVMYSSFLMTMGIPMLILMLHLRWWKAPVQVELQSV